MVDATQTGIPVGTKMRDDKAGAPASAEKPTPRYISIDVVRGLAIIGVVLYHFIWDLRFLQFMGPNPTLDVVWLWFARVLQVTFFALTGISLVLAHASGFHWPAFWKRFGIIGGAALLVTVGTYFAFGESFVYFGMLHALAILSVMALPFVRAPIWLVIVAAIVSIWVPFIYQNEIFNSRILSWIGFWTIPPYTQDLQSIFPGLGYVLAGVAAMRLVYALNWSDFLARLTSSGWLVRFLVRAGRWSLVIYLVHQPIMLSVLVPLANWLQPGQALVAQNKAEQQEIFYNTCLGAYANYQQNQNGEGEQNDAIGVAVQANAYCTCAAEIMAENDLFGVRTVEELTPQQSTIYGAIPQLCQAMARPLDLGIDAETAGEQGGTDG
jgi:uncharacterized membrane protein